MKDWKELRSFRTPEWLREKKFGIYTHWGVYSVPAFGKNGSWYPRNMYIEGSEQNEYHKKTFGDPRVFGYKDFIPMFTAEKFDADEWAELFASSGAGFAGPVAEHHDGFAMWNTALNPYNAAKMGPKRDVVAELERAYRARGLKFMVALHHIENWYFYPKWRADCDIRDPKYIGLYNETHDGDSEDEKVRTDFNCQEKPSLHALNMWLGKTKEIIDRFSPDLLWFDFGLRYVRDDFKREMLDYYYSRTNGGAVLFKNHDMCVGSGLIDLELGRYDDLTQNEWITDTTVDDGEAWCYVNDAAYKTPERMIHYLIDNVSKNGYLLINVGPKPDGTIPDGAKLILSELGAWLKINGEAIYSTTPWLFYGEGPTRMRASGMFSENEAQKYTAGDFRYTAKGDMIYAAALSWTDGEFHMTRLRELYPGEVSRVTMLGCEGELPFRQEADGLHVKSPGVKPCRHAYVMKIERRFPR